MEVKSDEGTVVVADRNRYSDECCNNRGWGQQEIKCLIENTAKDQEIARLNRVVDAQRDQNIINSVVQALGNKTA
jgi:hypothetical protein